MTHTNFINIMIQSLCSSSQTGFSNLWFYVFSGFSGYAGGTATGPGSCFTSKKFELNGTIK